MTQTRRAQRVAILGAGCTGVCAALELAANGCAVDLYDENPLPISRAGWVNEGKIHLGILYAKDRSLRTAELMITGALNFASSLNRWIDFSPDTVTLSTPFYYGVHEGTMVDVDELRRHYERCRRLFEDTRQATGLSYLGLDEPWCMEELDRREVERLVSSEYFLAVFRTSERSVDPRTVAPLLRASLRCTPSINFIGDTRVSAVERNDAGALMVRAVREGIESVESYDHVANTLWHGRLEIDATLDLRPGRAWLYRYKLGNRIHVPLRRETPPSLTCVLGPFGDIVNFGDQGMYLSWYPSGMMATSLEVRPPAWDQEFSAARRLQVFRHGYREWLARCPDLAHIEFDDDDVDPSGGVIFAWGSTDVEDPQSELHSRYEIGIHSLGNYHSVNTGKYTLAPYMGLKTAERILGLT